MTTTPAPPGFVPVPARVGDWVAMHIYYAASPRPLLAECIGPLLDDLHRDGLLAGHFFINYWLEGPHVRLRLRPATPQAGESVRARAEAAVSAFLKRRPALYNVETGFLSDLYNQLFDMDLEDVDRDRYVGADGKMNVRPNNSFAYQPYEPEFGKYGGPAGVALAEWHFGHSSDLVLEAVRTLNMHVRTVVLGTAAQLMMVMSAAFLPDGDELATYLERYHGFWRRTFAGTDLVDYGTRDADTPGLAARFASVRAAIATGDLDELPAFLARWARHCLELRERVSALAPAGQLVFRSVDRARDDVVTDAADARLRLLSPYLHMTNNRLHITIRDEAYLSAMLARALCKSLRPEVFR